MSASIQQDQITFYYQFGLITYGNIAVDLKRVVAIKEEHDGAVTFLFDGAEKFSWYMPYPTVLGFWKKFLALQSIK